ncbi:high affinity immunoglobulin gamma Fc receptor I-like isoform X1 [Anguilla anguilla]|uniref:high affinity immunoglobulin gamma Fc receptor I-like isoform X1 n=1 Tax=Anguilla anguilla TaxID=7936 RepID=UPI0015A9F121|nr:high affinity immunoglobulin gamma Fc receptor I-like isoform X1 [Anguilla anguilla]
MGAASFAVALVITASLHPGMSQDPRVTLTVEPPGPSVYVGETVSLRCGVSGDPPGNWTYRWLRGDPPAPCPQTRLRGAAGGRYTITAAETSDRGLYCCCAERGAPPTLSLPSNAVHLNVSEHPPALLILHPNSRQHFQGEKMTLWCPNREDNSTGWTLKHISGSGVQSGCIPAGGTVSTERPGACQISGLHSGNSGLYWCESDVGERRTSTVNITVVYGPIIIQSPAQPVAAGDSVTLRCLLWRQGANATAFYRDGVEVHPLNSTQVTLRNVTGADQGLYACAGPNGTESAGSWLSVRAGVLKTQRISPTDLQVPSTSPTEAPSPTGSWLMAVVPCCILGALLVLAFTLLACHRRSLLKCSCCSGCPMGSSHREGPKGERPQTKPDATEIQWDVPWTEMEATLLGGARDEEQGVWPPQAGAHIWGLNPP